MNERDLTKYFQPAINEQNNGVGGYSLITDAKPAVSPIGAIMVTVAKNVVFTKEEAESFTMLFESLSISSPLEEI